MPTKKKAVAEHEAPLTDEPTPAVAEHNPADPTYAGFEDILAGRTVLATSPVVQGAKVLPRIIGGKVEFDGLDYTVSPIYAHMNVVCSYCGQPPRPDRMTHAYIPDNDPEHVVFVCSDYTCTNNHRRKYEQSGSILPQ